MPTALRIGALCVGIVFSFAAAGAEYVPTTKNMDQVGFVTIDGTHYDVGPYSKLAPWPDTDGNILYSPCYDPAPLDPNTMGSAQCVMIIDITNRTKPTRITTIYAYDRVNSPQPPLDHPIWDNKQNAKWALLEPKSPCDAFKVDRYNQNPTCWDPGWNTHTHYAQMQFIAGRKILAVNLERWRLKPLLNQANYHGVAFYDVTDPHNPFFVSRWEAPVSIDPVKKEYVYANGTHHFNWGGHYLYLGTEYDGFVGRVLVILNVRNPGRPFEESHWWLKGQKFDTEYADADWVQQDSFSSPVRPADPAKPNGKLLKYVGQHYVTVRGSRAFLSYHQAGLIILNVKDKRKPKMISRLDYLVPDFPSPDAAECGKDAAGNQQACGNTHAAKPIPGRHNLIIVSDEYFACPYGHVRLVDISDERHPEIISHFLTDQNRNCKGTAPADPDRFPRRGPSSHLGNAWNPNLYFMAWYGMGVRAIDISNPYDPRPAGHFEYLIKDLLTPAQAASGKYAGSDTYDVIFGPGPENYLYVSDGTSGMRVVKYTGGEPKMSGRGCHDEHDACGEDADEGDDDGQ